MTKKIADIWMENRRAGNMSVTTELLLAPQFLANRIENRIE